MHNLAGLTPHQQSVWTDLLANPNKLAILTGSAGCVPASTEFLTPTGWKRIDNFTSSDLVCEWNQDGTTNFAKPLAYIKQPASSFNRIKTATVDMTISDSHRIPYITSKSNNQTKTYSQVTQLGSIRIPRTFEHPNNSHLSISNALLRVLIMQTADGSIVTNSKQFKIRINVKKARKRIRMIELLNAANIDYTIYNYTGSDAHNWTRLTYSPPASIAFKDLSPLWQLSEQQMHDLVDELFFWDGSHTPRKNIIASSFTGNKSDCDVVQYIASIAKQKYVSISQDNRQYKKEPIYSVRVSSRSTNIISFKQKNRSNARQSELLTQVPSSDGFEYCFTTSTGFWLMRQSNSIYPTGNSGKTFSTSTFISNLPSSERIMVTASTHKAVGNLNEFIPTNCDASTRFDTIHAFLNYTMSNDEDKPILIKRQAKGKYDSFDPTYLIIDEYSMLPAIIISDLIQLANDPTSKLVKIILIGDPIQLVINDFVFRQMSQIPSFELTENLRQSENDDLKPYLQSLRDKIETKDPNIEALPEDLSSTILHYDHDSFLQAYKKDQEIDKKIICYRNATVNKYNHAIKKYINKTEEIFSRNDLITVESPVYLINKTTKKTIFHNRAQLKIVTTPKIDIYLGVRHYYFKARDTTGKTGVIRVPLTKRELLTQLELPKQQKNWKKFYEIKESFNNCIHNMCCNVYNVQGMSISNIYVDITDMAPPSDPINQTLLRQVYVSLSRSRGMRHVFLGDTRKYTSLKD